MNTKKIRSEDVKYDSTYYENYNGKAYGRTPDWLTFFDNISENIIKTLNPKTVLDVGCAYGLLVETLRKRGVDAYGMDVSDYAIEQASIGIQEFLSVGSILNPLKDRYDLIVSIEVIEHIDEKYCDQVIKNMCDASDQILLATTPDDFDDPTHFNVRPPVYWIQQFSKRGFEPELTYNAGFLTPYAILFKKNFVALKPHIHSLFGEKKLQDLYFSRVIHERNVQITEIENVKRDLDSSKKDIRSLEVTLKDSQVHIENLQESLQIEKTARGYYQQEIQKIQSSWFWKLMMPYRGLKKVFNVLSPVLDKVVAKNSAASLDCDSDCFKGWGVLVAKLRDDENVVLKLNVNYQGKSERVKTLPITENGNRRAWIFRNKTEYQNFLASILYGHVEEIKFLKISTASALSKLIRYRWNTGYGFKPATSLLLRCARLLISGHPRAVFEEIWPSIKSNDDKYQTWLDRYDNSSSGPLFKDWLASLDYRPLISIVLPTFNSDLVFLSNAIKSVELQSYENWQLCIADDGSADLELKKYLKGLSSSKKIEVRFRNKNGHIAAASNSAIELAKGEFIAFLDHDDELHPHALACIVAELNKNPNLDLIYTDEDKIDSWGNRTEPNFKSDWNPDLLLSQNYICHLAVYRSSIIREIGGIRLGFEGAQDYDLLLRFTERTQRVKHVPFVLYHWRAITGSTALAVKEKNYAHAKAEEALKENIARRGTAAKVMPSGLEVYHRIKYEIQSPNPLVSIIIPTRDRIDLLRVCLDGIVNKTSYKNWEVIIVDNDSQKKESHRYFESIQSERIRILKFEGEFNYSAINNFGAAQSNGEILLLLNNDIEMIVADWLTELVSHVIRPGIGTVGARLYYSDNSIQHDGILMGIGGVAGYANPGLNRYDVAPFGGSRLIRNFSAVTAAVLAVRKSIFDEVNGLDEVNLKVAFNDVDFCLRVGEAGYRNLYTPYCELFHHESLSRGSDIEGEKALRFQQEVDYMKKKWSEVISNDPYYNPNLSLDHGFTLDVNRGSRWPWEEDKELL